MFILQHMHDVVAPVRQLYRLMAGYLGHIYGFDCGLLSFPGLEIVPIEVVSGR
jgi:hypothetical protein